MSMQFPFNPIFVLALILSLFATSATAQDDPFATPASTVQDADKDSPEAGLPAMTRDMPASTRLIIESLRKTPPQSVEDFCFAIRSTFDLDQFEDAKFYLKQLQSALKNDNDRLTAQSKLGSRMLVEIQFSDFLKPVGAEVVSDIIQGANRAAYAPERLNKLVRELSSPDRSLRGTSFRMLRRLGSPASAAILNAFGNPDREPEFPYLRNALKNFGTTAVPPLIGASRATNLQVQIEALRALTHYNSEDANDALLRAYLSPKFPESLRRSALAGLKENSKIISDPVAAENALYEHAMDLLTGKQDLASYDANSRRIWHWNSTRRQLEPLSFPSKVVAQVRAANRASDLFEIRPESKRNRSLFLLTQLESAKRLLGPSNNIEKKRFIKLLPDLTWQEVNETLAKAIQLELFPAASGCCELLGQFGDAQALYPPGGGRSNLIKALLTGERHLQFAAFEAVDKINPQKPYNGASFIMAMATFVAGGGGQNAGLIGHRLTNLGQSYAATLLQTGYAGVSANNGRDFFEAAGSNPDIQFLVISDTMSFPDSIELAQQLRNDWRTKRMPISMAVTSEDSKIRMERVFRRNKDILVHRFTLDAPVIHAQIGQMFESQGAWKLTPEDRRRHSFAAMRWLDKVASDRDTFKFYELGRHEKALTRLIYAPGFSEVAGKVLSALGTPAAQREMMNFASQANLPIEEREPIAKALIESINRSGTLLTSREIRMQYDRYNAAEYESKPQQELLGSLLDAIEVGVKKRGQ